MSPQHARPLSRRRFLGGLTLTGTAGLLACQPGGWQRSRRPRRIRLVQMLSMCQAPQYMAEELLRGERFTDVDYPNELKQELKG